MNDTRQALGQDATERDMIVTVADAAVLFNISEGAVRKRIERGQLAAQKVAGQWRIILNATDATHFDTTARQNTTNTAPLAPPDAARTQLDAVMHEWLAPLIRQIAEQAEIIGEQRERIEHLSQAREAAERERDELRAMMQHITAVTPIRRRSWWHRFLFSDFDAAPKEEAWSIEQSTGD